MIVTPPPQPLALQVFVVVEDDQFTEADYKNMIHKWICIEDDKNMLDGICEEKMEELESNPKPAVIDDADDDNEPEPMEVDVDGSDAFSSMLKRWRWFES